MADVGNGRHRPALQKSSSTLVDAIVHYKRRIEVETHDDEKVLHALKKLRSYPIDGASLEATNVLTTVYGLKTRTGEVGSLSRALVHDWKKIVSSGSTSKTRTTSSNSSKSRSKDGDRCRHDNNGADIAKPASTSDQQSSKKIRVRVEHAPSSSPSSKSNRKGKSASHQTSVVAAASKNGHFATATMDIDMHSTVDLPRSSSATGTLSTDGRITIFDTSATSSSSSLSSRDQSDHAKESVRKPKKAKNSKLLTDSGGEGFNASMASFEDCLGLNDFKSKPSSSSSSSTAAGTAVSSSARKKTKKGKSEDESRLKSMLPPPPPPKKSNSNSKTDQLPSLLAVDPRDLSTSDSSSSPTKKPFASHVDILSSLPAIQTDYKPFRFPTPDSPPSKSKQRELVESTTFMSSRHRNTRTQVFSGRRSQFLTQVPTLLKSCIKVLQENVAVLSDLMYAPYEHLKPALQRCTPDRLLYLEEMNPYILDETDELWKLHCQREFKTYEPDEFESWRELYYRVSVARTSRLRSITANISASMAKAVPVRQTKLAFLDCEAKPPRQVARQQAKFGTAKGEPVIKLGRTKVLASAGSSSASKGPSESHSSGASSSSSSNGPSTSQPQVKVVKKVAPLMQKTLKLMKNRFRR